MLFRSFCLQNNLVKLKGVDDFINYLLRDIETVRRNIGDTNTLDKIIKLCRKRKELNQMYREEDIAELNSLKQLLNGGGSISYDE